MMWVEVAFSSILLLLAASLLLSSPQQPNHLADFALQMRLEDAVFAMAENNAPLADCGKYFADAAPLCAACYYSDSQSGEPGAASGFLQGASAQYSFSSEECSSHYNSSVPTLRSASRATSMDGKLRLLTMRAYYPDAG